MVMSERQPGMTQKREGQLRLPAHTGKACAEWRAQRGEVRRADIGQLAGLDVAPELFDRVQVGRIAWQPLDRQPRVLSGQVGGHHAARVTTQAIPDEQQALPGEVALEIAQKADQGRVRVAPRTRVEEEARPAAVPAKRQGPGDRQPLPMSPRVDQDRRFAARSPGATDDGLLRDAAFVFEDESGVSQQPVVRRTWAPRGETPVLIHTGGHWKRLSIAGALAFRWDGRRTRFFFHTRAGSYTDAALICFLRDLKRHFPRQRLLLIWDGLSGHTSRVMTAYLARQHAWLTVERLPGYAPDLNPIEQLWGNVKTRELANVCAPNLAALRPPLRAGFARVRRQPQLAFAFLRHAGLAF